MKFQSLLVATALLPLTACFEGTIPYNPPAAELQDGEWLFEMTPVAVDGDCWGMSAHDLEQTTAWAWIESDDEDVSIDLEGIWLEGEIYGESLSAEGSMSMDYSTGEDPVEVPSDPDWDDDDSDDENEGDDGSDNSTSSDGGPTMICEETVEAVPEEIFATMDADILAADHMRGSIVIDYTDYGVYCSMEFEFEAQALYDSCDCDCGCDEDDHDHSEESKEGSAGSEPETEVPGD